MEIAGQESGMQKENEKGTLIVDYKSDPVLRNLFYDFIDTVFPSADFREWCNKGFWADEFVPYSLVDDGKIISNVCISKMKLLIEGNETNGIQIGAVGTIPEYRNKGLSRYLMDIALDKYQNSADLFFLFANETVTDFYPKFGFKQYNEVVYRSESDIPASNYSARKLNISDQSDITILNSLLNRRAPLTKLFGAVDYSFITMWHVFNICKDDIYYLEDENIIVIYTQKNNHLDIWDVIYEDEFDITETLSKVINNKIESINFHFPPDVLNYKYDHTEKSDTLLFIRGEFKLSDITFKFPVTAQT